MALSAERRVDLARESIWISYTPMELTGTDPDQLRHFTSHHRLAAPVSAWESLKIGSGTPPVMTRHGWLFVYHGVSDAARGRRRRRALPHLQRRGDGALVATTPRRCSTAPPSRCSCPVPSDGPRGTPSNVVFPTGIDRRTDIGEPHRYDVYYGINDFRIGVARMDVPESIPHLPTRTPRAA